MLGVAPACLTGAALEGQAGGRSTGQGRNEAGSGNAGDAQGGRGCGCPTRHRRPPAWPRAIGYCCAPVCGVRRARLVGRR
eukprot:scaffold23011_cov126-Isochrysis_galbana.AAC.5